MPRRVLTSIVLAVIGLPAIVYGGVFYFALIAVVLAGSAWEFVRMYRAVQFEPHEWVTLGGVLLTATARFFFADAAIPVMVLSIMVAMTVHLFAFERGRDKAALDFCITTAGIAYLGWLGSYLLDLRALPAGGWWLMFILPLVWAGDTGAYSIGSAYGKHKMAPRLSPKKSWEGYFAGVFTAVIVGAFFAYAYSTLGPQPLGGLITPLQGALFGLVIGAVTPLGDLGESMFKRQSGMKDSSHIFPGHGGFLDRIDSWLWGAPLGYFLIRYFIF
ncbi:MAG: phosphatidate cytidylyltransferase [Chloroflexota bacterium]